MMAVPQVIVVALLFMWQQPAHAAVVLFLLVTQLVLMHRFLSDPQKRAIWYSAFGVTLYVLGMLVTAFALRIHTGAT